MSGATRAQVAGVAIVMAGTFVAALDVTVVGTAMPTVIGELGGIDRYGWVFSAYLLVSTATTPLFGRLADMLGRKRVYSGALIAFVGFSMLAGVSRSMNELILFRALQGLGAGALLPTGFTMIGDLFEVRQRAKVQGLFSAVWAISAIAGPTIGGLLTQTISWRWVFFVNLPIGAVAFVLLLAAFQDRAAHRQRRMDWAGAGTFALAASALLLGLNGTMPAATLTAAAIIAYAFIRIERIAAEPMIELAVLRSPLVSAAMLITFLSGGIQFAVLTYLPPFVQGVLGRTPLEAGLSVATLSIGWSAGSVVLGWYLLRLGLRRAVLVGGLFLSIGTALLVGLTENASLAVVIAGASATGFGMGFSATPLLVSVQSAAGYARRGISTSLIQFSRTLGGAAGVAAVGSLLIAALGSRAADVSLLLNPTLATRAGLAETRLLLADGLHAIYVALFGLGLASIALAFRLPKTVPPDADQAASAAVSSPTVTTAIAPDPN
jgi:EmrB/QacA subfamily drug resistance transporter